MSIEEGRIYGTEMEYGIQVRVHDPCVRDRDLQATDSEVVWLIRKHLPEDLSILDGFVSNGARLYKDVGAAVEYATPEDVSVVGTLANEIAGERILGALLEAASESRRFAKIEANKRVVPYYGQPDISWGYHENYLAYRQYVKINERDLSLVGMHVATRSLFCGAGGIMLPPNIYAPPIFWLAQKAPRLDEAYNLGTTGHKKPLINLRDEALADANEYARVHITSGDAHMSPWATRMQLGTTGLVLALNRFKGVTLPSLESLADNVLAIGRQTATDLSLQKPLRTYGRTVLRPMDIQRELLETVSKTIPDSELTEEERWTITEWDRVLNDLEEDPSLARDRVEWVAKKRSFDKKPKDRDWATKLDMSWDSLDPAKSYGLKLRKTVWSQWMPDEALIQDRMVNPPTGTRALLRGQAVALMSRPEYRSSGNKVDWENVVYQEGKTVERHRLAPFDIAHPGLVALIERLSNMK